METADGDFTLRALIEVRDEIAAGIRSGEKFGYLVRDLGAAKAKLAESERAIIDYIRARYGEAALAAVMAQVGAMPHQAAHEIDRAVARSGLKGLGAKLERSLQKMDGYFGVTEHDEEVPTMSFMNPVKREMIDWVLLTLKEGETQIERVRRAWAWYEGSAELKKQHPMRFESFKADVSKYLALQKKGRYRPRADFRLLKLPME